MRFVLKLYQRQLGENRAFIHEQPANATSWALEEMKEVMRKEGVAVYQADQCMYLVENQRAS